MGGKEKGVKLFGMWASPFSLRVELALVLKGVEYEYLNEDLPHSKSPELLHYNPITKKIPTLVHDGKAVAESLVIIEYVDEAWTDGHPIMPKDPYERAQARFWAQFAEDKCMQALKSVFEVYCSAGEGMQKAVREAQECLKTLEKALEGKKFFGDEDIGYLDIAVGWMPFWIRTIEDLAGISVVNDESLPLMNAWFDRFLNVAVIKEKLPPKDKFYGAIAQRKENQ